MGEPELSVIEIERRLLLTLAAGSLVGCLASLGVSLSLHGDAYAAMLLAWLATALLLVFALAMLFLGIDAAIALSMMLGRYLRRGHRSR
jgi:NhaP-type Na+/H+ or K+/H+ antiporter